MNHSLSLHDDWLLVPPPPLLSLAHRFRRWSILSPPPLLLMLLPPSSIPHFYQTGQHIHAHEHNYTSFPTFLSPCLLLEYLYTLVFERRRVSRAHLGRLCFHLTPPHPTFPLFSWIFYRVKCVRSTSFPLCLLSISLFRLHIPADDPPASVRLFINETD